VTEDQIIDILREFLWAGVWIGAPLIISALVVGVVIGLFQALTSIQELTLTFAPKLLVLVLVFWLCSGYMAQSLVKLFDEQVIGTIVGAQ